eukprot:762374-Rhodomonas_salina.2
MLGACKEVAELGLSNTSTADTGVGRLAGVLGECKALLELSENCIGDEGAESGERGEAGGGGRSEAPRPDPQFDAARSGGAGLGQWDAARACPELVSLSLRATPPLPSTPSGTPSGSWRRSSACR